MVELPGRLSRLSKFDPKSTITRIYEAAEYPPTKLAKRWDCAPLRNVTRSEVALNWIPQCFLTSVEPGPAQSRRRRRGVQPSSGRGAHLIATLGDLATAYV